LKRWLFSDVTELGIKDKFMQGGKNIACLGGKEHNRRAHTNALEY